MERFALCASRNADLMMNVNMPVVWRRRNPEPGFLLKVKSSELPPRVFGRM